MDDTDDQRRAFAELASAKGCTECKECPFVCDDGLCFSRARAWLAEHPKPEAPIIGWPGNVEEMRQYEGRLVGMSDIYDQIVSTARIRDTLKFTGITEFPFEGNTICGSFRYCCILPEPILPDHVRVTRAEIAAWKGCKIEELEVVE